MKPILFSILILLIIVNLDLIGAEQSTRDVGFMEKYIVHVDEESFQIITERNFAISSHQFNTNDRMLKFNIETGLEKENIGGFIIPRDLLDGEFTVLLDDKEIPHKLSNTSETTSINIVFDGIGAHTISITATEYLGVEYEKSNSGGCLIATATFGSELSPQVQLLREIRDNTVLQTESGTTFMTGFNQFYYSFSPTIADYERENIVFKEAVKVTITPMLTSLEILNYVDINSEEEMLGYGIGIILLNIGMYFIAPSIIIMKIRKRVNIEKFDENYA